MKTLAILALAIVASCGSVSAQSRDKKYGPGVTDQEIKLGQTVPYSGPVSAAAALGRGALAYFERVNREKGGVNGRKIKLISLDDAYSPPKAFEQIRKLVEKEGILAIVGSAGSPTGVAVQAYLNKAGVPTSNLGQSKIQQSEALTLVDRSLYSLPYRRSDLRKADSEELAK